MERAISEKIGVVLFNLGGPDSLEAVRPFLFNLFSDPDIFKFPLSFLLRKPLAYLVASLRAPKSRVYFEYMGGKTPLTELTLRQAEALEKSLNQFPPSPPPSPSRGEGGQVLPSPLTGEGQGEGDRRFKVVVAMRYWTPDTDEAIDQLQKEDIRRVVLLPLYPHYSYTSTRSSYREWQRCCRKRGVRFEKEILISDYYNSPDYLAAIAGRIREVLATFSLEERKNLHLLFSAHSIPLREIEGGDPYPAQIKKSVEGVMKELQYSFPYHLSYQSRVGPLKWLGPPTLAVIPKLASEGVQNLIAIPISFVSDHSETLYELKKLYGELALQSGMKRYELMPALNDAPLFIEALKKKVLEGVERFIV